MSQGSGPRLRPDFWHDARLNCSRLFSLIRTRDGEVDEAFGWPLAWRVVSERMHEADPCAARGEVPGAERRILAS